ncbi:MAG: UDP-N-acetylmuramoyl-L-alanyl-D-glutamate--2,6-diaminopimelate ligase [Deltaproteobacteria bacterium RIFCSPLOWO2_12_FULL_50_11]|nr:MAG: UDP-N-acetylmuramoyl-L-alanyl-D-glutamate--2,6-diaminopimelate ligase [Deltaproteobacteria bacterium RIFCSPHIGHO2_02_FULL_50_15]OGQ66784.1 MAG: UDP-N-acetylmuramoyl-L-alanyl-D-glutamate--2,6-diaminopimelate ligase [Deltaproteobacteria bacterium RIFCSPLOWO2_12_FULL_50_11]
MKLEKLIDASMVVDQNGEMKTEISNIAYHSGAVGRGFLFCALPGLVHQGEQFIQEAVGKKAAAIIGSISPKKLNIKIPYLQVREPRKALAFAATQFFQEPSRFFNLIGVTGTNGKTTITFLLESILKAAGRHPGVIGTINYRYKDKVLPSLHTTPESLDLQKILAEMQQAGVTDVIMEVSSHALMMDRVYGCHFNGGIFTNLSQDHLDFHKNMEDYFRAKQTLFDNYLVKSEKEKKWCVLNISDSYAKRIPRNSKIRYLECSCSERADYWIQKAYCDLSGFDATMETPQGPILLKMALIGDFNLENCLLSIAAAHSMGLSNEVIIRGLQNFPGVPGRLQRVKAAKNFSVLIDYAHTPDALRAVTETLKPLTQGRLIVVFGCGGDRDRTKRPQMGEMASRHADVAIVTSDNPRTEEPKQIIQDILPGVIKAGLSPYQESAKKGFIVLSDRKSAIEQALLWARSQDTVLIAGKGHENYQIIGTKRNHFDDYEIVEDCLRKIKGTPSCD